MEVGPGEGRDLLQAPEGKPHHAGLAVSWQKSADQVLGSMLAMLRLWSPEAERQEDQSLETSFYYTESE